MRPTILLYPLTGLVCGIILQKQYEFFVPTLFAATLFAFITFLFCIQVKTPLPKRIACTLFFTCTGALLLCAQMKHHKQLQQNLPKGRVTITARVLGKKETPGGFYKETLTLHVQELDYKVMSHSQRTRIRPGDLVELRNVILTTPKHKPTIAGNPTYYEYLVKENVVATVFARKLSYTILKENSFSLKRWVLQKRDKLFLAFREKIPQPAFGYFASIFLGNKSSGLSTSTRHQFRNWGISHHLARSGLHIALFILIWIYLLSLIPLPFIAKHLILTAICTTYTLLSWSSTSFTRALSLFLLYELGIILNRQVNFLYLLQLIALIILFFNPIQLFFLDFQLSFGITLALALVFSTPKKSRKSP